MAIDDYTAPLRGSEGIPTVGETLPVLAHVIGVIFNWYADWWAKLSTGQFLELDLLQAFCTAFIVFLVFKAVHVLEQSFIAARKERAK